MNAPAFFEVKLNERPQRLFEVIRYVDNVATPHFCSENKSWWRVAFSERPIKLLQKHTRRRLNGLKGRFELVNNRENLTWASC